MDKKKLISAAIAGLVVAGLASSNAFANHKGKPHGKKAKHAKKAGKNGCNANSCGGKNSCSGKTGDKGAETTTGGTEGSN